MEQGLKIYIAGPYTAQTDEQIEANTASAIDAGIEVFKRGHYPFIPHLTHFVDLRARSLKVPMAWEDYLAWDKPWLDMCDALLFLAPSRGATLELEHAKTKGLQIFQSIAEIPNLTRVRENPFSPS